MVLSAQTQRAGQMTPGDELLGEVRGLRVEINQAAGASIRTQLLVARLQLQEQTLTAVSGQLEEVRRRLWAFESGRIPVATELKQLEDATLDIAITPAQRKDAEAYLEQVQAQFEQRQRDEERLRGQEADLTNALAAEQGRWLDFNSRLDSMERSLATEPLR